MSLEYSHVIQMGRDIATAFINTRLTHGGEAGLGSGFRACSAHALDSQSSIPPTSTGTDC